MTCKISWFHFGGLKSSISHSHDSLEVFHGAQMPQHQFHIFSGGWLSKSCTRITKHHQTSEMMRSNAPAFFYPTQVGGAVHGLRLVALPKLDFTNAFNSVQHQSHFARTHFAECTL